MLDKSRLEFQNTLNRYRKALLDKDSELADKLYVELIQLAASGRFPKTETEHALSEIAHSREVSSQGDFNAEAVAKLREYMSDDKRAERRQQRTEERGKMRRDVQRRLAISIAARAGKRAYSAIKVADTKNENWARDLAARIKDIYGDRAAHVRDGAIERLSASPGESTWVAGKQFDVFLDATDTELQVLGTKLGEVYGKESCDKLVLAISDELEK